MRADRLISIMLLLQIHRRLTARDLAARLEVSERTIHRDMDVLSAAGIPVFAERGTGGGWMLTDGYRTSLTGLNEAEIQALFLTLPPRLFADLGIEKAAQAGLLKLQAALPAARRREAERLHERIHIDPTGWRNATDAVPLLPLLLEAVRREHKLKFSYDRGGDCTVERLAEPLGLVAKGSAWYLVAVVDGDVRSYRVSRVRAAEMAEESFARPADFDLAAHWQQSAVEFKEKLPRFPVLVRVEQSVLPLLHYAGRFARVGAVQPPDADGRVRVELIFQFEEDACECLLGFGPKVELLAPAELRERIVAQARRVIEFYESPSNA